MVAVMDYTVLLLLELAFANKMDTSSLKLLQFAFQNAFLLMPTLHTALLLPDAFAMPDTLLPLLPTLESMLHAEAMQQPTLAMPCNVDLVLFVPRVTEDSTPVNLQPLRFLADADSTALLIDTTALMVLPTHTADANQAMEEMDANSLLAPLMPHQTALFAPTCTLPAFFHQLELIALHIVFVLLDGAEIPATPKIIHALL